MLTTVPASEITTGSAVLNATAFAISDLDWSEGLEFQYGITTAYSTVIAPEPDSTYGSASSTASVDVGGLSANTLYHFRFVGNGTGHSEGRIFSDGSIPPTGYSPMQGDDRTFYTAANIPGALTVTGITETNAVISLNDITSNGNPAYTEYVIQNANSNQYVQADGTFGDAPVWLTADGWNAIVLAGLASGTTYSLQVKARNGDLVETEFGDAVTFSTSLLGLNDFGSLNKIQISPNPTTGELTITAQTAIGKIFVYDVQARLLLTNLADDRQAKIDLSAYPRGMYFVKVFTGEGMKAEKVVRK